MSGLLRRIKRSRSADAGETHAEGQAAGPEGAPTTAETAELPAGATAPAIKADPNAPAGLDPAEPVAPPAGRRGRLRRRLRYLRRARELMLRDLGGLLYEVNRTGGGDVAAHAGVIGGKLERLARLDAEAAAIETALGARRSEAVVFEPGIGGTCAVCGELYGSAARFCSHCGTPTGVTAATPSEPRHVPAMPKAPAATGAGEERGPAEYKTRQLEGTGGEAAGDEAWKTVRPDKAGGEAAGDEAGNTAVPDTTGGKSAGNKLGNTAGPDTTGGESAGDKLGNTAGPDTTAGDEAGNTAGPDTTAGDEAGNTAGPDTTAGDETRELEPTRDSARGVDEVEKTTRAGDGTRGVHEAGNTARPGDETRDADAADAREPSSGRSNGRTEDRSPGLSSGDPLATRERS
jgi:hypothetical protein